MRVRTYNDCQNKDLYLFRVTQNFYIYFEHFYSKFENKKNHIGRKTKSSFLWEKESVKIFRVIQLIQIAEKSSHATIRMLTFILNFQLLAPISIAASKHLLAKTTLGWHLISIMN